MRNAGSQADVRSGAADRNACFCGMTAEEMRRAGCRSGIARPEEIDGV